ERPFAGAAAGPLPGATLRHRTGLVPAVLPASTEQGKRATEVPQGRGEILSSPQRHPGRSYRVTNPRPRRRPRPPGSEPNEGTLRYRQAKATKGGGTGDRRS